MDLKSKIRVALGLEEPTTEVKLAMEAQLEDGTIIVSEANELVAGVDISILAEDGTLIPLPAGEYKTDAGVGFSVVDEGVVAEIYDQELVYLRKQYIKDTGIGILMRDIIKMLK